jgi:hypothetical protein
VQDSQPGSGGAAGSEHDQLVRAEQVDGEGTHGEDGEQAGLGHGGDQPGQGLGHDRNDDGFDPVEDALGGGGVAIRHVDPGDGADDERSGSDEADSGDDEAPAPAAVPAEVDG